MADLECNQYIHEYTHCSRENDYFISITKIIFEDIQIPDLPLEAGSFYTLYRLSEKSVDLLIAAVVF